ncbi:hypothetical protein J31TS6_00280 [Brevibacillus reuszeri]|nr:hypothetical protein J31TS6_00280 [Brevibacillus reuszeri]
MTRESVPRSWSVFSLFRPTTAARLRISFIVDLPKTVFQKYDQNPKLAEKKGEGREALWNTNQGAVEKEKHALSVQL